MARPKEKLKAHWFHILLSLADKDQHGLAIMKEVLDRTDGQMQLWPGMLYGALKRMSDDDLIAEAQAPPDAETGGGKPRFYSLTPLGRQILIEEVERLSRFVEAARAKNLVGPRQAEETRS